MKITRLTTYRVPPRWLFLKIETDAGVVGWGEPVIEGRARTVEAAVHELSDYLVGKDPARINDLWQMLYRGGFYRGGPILMSAIAGIDQALWDIKGKVLNSPVWQLMGGLVRDKIKAYSWVGGDRPAEVIDGIKTLRNIGFDTFKLNGCEEMGVIDNSRAVDAAVKIHVGRSGEHVVAAVVAHHDQQRIVGTEPYLVGDFERKSRTSALVPADIVAVDEDVGHALHAVEFHE
mgnify:CR=1 FL=1